MNSPSCYQQSSVCEKLTQFINIFSLLRWAAFPLGIINYCHNSGDIFFITNSNFSLRILNIWQRWKGNYQSTDNTKNRKRNMKLLPKNEVISGRKAHTTTRKLIWNISTITHVFLNQKRVNVCEHMVKTVPHLFFWLRKASVIVKTFELSFHVFVCAFRLEISSFFSYEFPLSFPFFFFFYTGHKYTNIQQIYKVSKCILWSC